MAGVTKDKARRGRRRRKLAAMVGVAVYALIRAPASTETAVANGDTRTLTFVNNHTNESGSFTYRVNGGYDEAVLEKLNWFMRDWRLNEQTKMDPRLFDILWEVYREAGSSEPIDVLSAYRSPQTNAMLRRRSRLVAEHSQHMQGRAIDAHFQDQRVASVRDVAMRMQEGGVGFYPIGNTPWIHVDSGTVRYWPRMSRASLARLFPDGKTVFIPADGQPMERYADAKAMIEARGGEVQMASGGGGLFSWLFGGARGGGADDEEETSGARVISGGRGGPPMMTAMSGRGGAFAPVVAIAEPVAAKPEPPAPKAAPAPPPPPPLVETVASLEPAAPEPAADAGAPDETAAAPAPPRKPADVAADDDEDVAVPLPPKRPNRLTIAQAPAKGAPSGDDLIATLIERKALPPAITKDVHAAPKSALALVEARSTGASAEALTRAATLAFPPLPPARPKPAREEPAKEAAAPLPPPRPTKGANPYGGLITDGFSASKARTASED